MPKGLYILPSVISSFYFFTRSSVSTGPIFTIFSPNGRYLREFSRSNLLFSDSSIYVAMATNFVVKVLYVPMMDLYVIFQFVKEPCHDNLIMKAN